MKWCGCIAENCDTCYEYSVIYCDSGNFISVPSTNLINHHTYYIWIRDKMGNIFTTSYSLSPGGHLRIYKPDFPNGMVTPNFGAMDVYVSTDAYGQVVQPLTIGGKSYNCVFLTIDNPVYLTSDDGCTILTDDNGNALINQ